MLSIRPEEWTKMSCPEFDGLIRPKPFSSLKNFTVPSIVKKFNCNATQIVKTTKRVSPLVDLQKLLDWIACLKQAKNKFNSQLQHRAVIQMRSKCRWDLLRILI